MTAQEDYELAMQELGFQEPLIQKLVTADNVILTSWGSTELRPSHIHGKGIFAKDLILAGELIGKARLGTQRTQFGRYTNHHPTPNAIFTNMPGRPNIVMVAKENIDNGAEITVDYRESYKAALVANAQ